MPRRTRADRAAGWLAEAISTGDTLAPLPADAAPRSRAEGERAALLALAALGLPPCGLRMLDGAAGPMLEGRLLASGAVVSGVAHPVATAALVGVLAEALEPGEDGAPRLSAVHPAIDVAGSRFTTVPAGAALRAADLAGLGMVVAGEAAVAPAGGIVVETAAGAFPVDAALAFAAVAAAARRLGGLPAGALLVAAGLSPPLERATDGRVAARFGVMGEVSGTVI